jgi:hypothetical protein
VAVPQALKTSDMSCDELELPPDGSLTIGAHSVEPKPSFPGNNEVGVSAARKLKKGYRSKTRFLKKDP